MKRLPNESQIAAVYWTEGDLFSETFGHGWKLASFCLSSFEEKCQIALYDFDFFFQNKRTKSAPEMKHFYVHHLNLPLFWYLFVPYLLEDVRNKLNLLFGML